MQTLEIRRSQSETGVHVIEVAGSLDARNFERLEQVFDSYFEEGVYNIVVDISQVEYISSAGVGVLIGAAGRSQANEGNIVAAGPRESVREIFDLLGVGHILPVVASREKAFEFFTAYSP